jgi:hypothetical protein
VSDKQIRLRLLAAIAAVAAGVAAVIVAVVLVRSALADGDPASDVLVAESVFYPYSSNVAQALQARLNAEAAAATRARYPFKVALIAAPSDLGAVTSLFGKPQQYAAFLDQEISFLDIKPALLVVMPNGYGVHDVGSAVKAAAGALKKPAGARPDDLAQAAIAALPKLAAAAGHPFGPLPGASTSHGASTALKAVVLALAAIVVAGALVLLRAVRVGRRASRGNERRGHG